jgi:hypothetical protein
MSQATLEPRTKPGFPDDHLRGNDEDDLHAETEPDAREGSGARTRF